MNAEQMLNLVPPAIEARKPSITGRWDIIWSNYGIVCNPAEDRKHADDLLLTINWPDITQGLSQRQWRQIKKRIGCVLKRERRY